MFERTAAAAMKGAQGVLFLAPERQFKDGWLARSTQAPWRRLLDPAATDTPAGVGGKLVSAQNPDAGPRRLLLGILPDRVSRHNCPARSVAAEGLIQAAELTPGKMAVVLCCEEKEHALPLARALGSQLPTYSRVSERRAQSVLRLAVLTPQGRPRPLPAIDQEIVRRARWAAQLVDMPTAEMHTPDFVRETRKAARGLAHVKVSVLSGAALLEKKLAGLHAVGRTAIHPPKLLLLHYNPPQARRRLALVGKGIVYDTGGLSLKTGKGMSGMKGDMGGAAGMVGAALALAATGHPDEIICAAALAENAIGPTAYRPDDILRMHSGKTVEINNTDAEGRLVLADAASYVARRYKPSVLIDMATLTGAQLLATGSRHAALVSNREGLEDAAVRAGTLSGDLAHPLPFAPELYQGEFSSKVADMRNSVANRMNAQTSCAAQFVYDHIADLDLPWLHVDMAGPSFRADRATGYGVAFTATLARLLSPKDLRD